MVERIELLHAGRIRRAAMSQSSCHDDAGRPFQIREGNHERAVRPIELIDYAARSERSTRNLDLAELLQGFRLERVLQYSHALFYERDGGQPLVAAKAPKYGFHLLAPYRDRGCADQSIFHLLREVRTV